MGDINYQILPGLLILAIAAFLHYIDPDILRGWLTIARHSLNIPNPFY